MSIKDCRLQARFHTGCAGAPIADLRRMPRHRGRLSATLVLVAVAAAIPVAAWNVIKRRASAMPAVAPAPSTPENPVERRRRADFDAMRAFRPGYTFWQHIFTMPDQLGRVRQRR